MIALPSVCSCSLPYLDVISSLDGVPLDAFLRLGELLPGFVRAPLLASESLSFLFLHTTGFLFYRSTTSASPRFVTRCTSSL